MTENKQKKNVEHANEELEAVFTFKTEDGKPVMPDGNLPDFAKKRCDWVLKFVDMGLNFMGELEFVLALDEAEAKEQFERGALGGEWMPVSEEFRNWINSNWSSIHQVRVALYLIYGDSSANCEEAE